MYFDNLNKVVLSRYPAPIARALQWLQSQDIAALNTGRYEIDGEKMYAQVIDTQTKPLQDTRPESHRRYLDVQYLHSGEESIGIVLASGNEAITQDYDPETDAMLYQTTLANESILNIHPGQFSVFFPTDIHRPGVATTTAMPIRKVVIKIAIDTL